MTAYSDLIDKARKEAIHEFHKNGLCKASVQQSLKMSNILAQARKYHALVEMGVDEKDALEWTNDGGPWKDIKFGFVNRQHFASVQALETLWDQGNVKATGHRCVFTPEHPYPTACLRKRVISGFKGDESIGHLMKFILGRNVICFLSFEEEQGISKEWNDRMPDESNLWSRYELVDQKVYPISFRATTSSKERLLAEKEKAQKNGITKTQWMDSLLNVQN